MMTYPEFAVESDWEATVTEWLAGLFVAPLTHDAVISYRDGIGAHLLEELEHQPGCYEGARLMQMGLTCAQSSRTLARQLSMSFNRLFEGVGGPQTVSPFESAQASPRGRLFQTPTAEMDLLLSQSNLVLASGPREPADHLSVQLALLAHLLRSAERREAARLIDLHLLNWVPGFAQALLMADDTSFYAGAGSLLVGFLNAQRRTMDDRSRGAEPRLGLPQPKNEANQ